MKCKDVKTDNTSNEYGINIHKHHLHLNASMYHCQEFQENIPKMKPQMLGEHNQCDPAPDMND